MKEKGRGERCKHDRPRAQLDFYPTGSAPTATTVDEEEPQLLSQEIASERVVSLEDALAVIKNGVYRTKSRS